MNEKNNKGFTLIEILLAITLSTVLIFTSVSIMQSVMGASQSVVSEGKRNNLINAAMETVRNSVSNAISMDVLSVSGLTDIAVDGNHDFIYCVDNVIYMNGAEVLTAKELGANSLELVYDVDGKETLEAYLFIDGEIYPKASGTNPTQSFYIPSIFGTGDDCRGIVCDTGADIMTRNCIYYQSDFN